MGRGAGGGLSQGTSVTASGHMTCRFPALYPGKRNEVATSSIYHPDNELQRTVCHKSFVSHYRSTCTVSEHSVLGGFWSVLSRPLALSVEAAAFPSERDRLLRGRSRPATAHILRSVTVLYDGWLGCVGFKGCCIQSQTTASAELSSKAAGFPSSGT